MTAFTTSPLAAGLFFGVNAGTASGAVDDTIQMKTNKSDATTDAVQNCHKQDKIGDTLDRTGAVHSGPMSIGPPVPRFGRFSSQKQEVHTHSLIGPVQIEGYSILESKSEGRNRTSRDIEIYAVSLDHSDHPCLPLVSRRLTHLMPLTGDPMGIGPHWTVRWSNQTEVFSHV